MRRESNFLATSSVFFFSPFFSALNNSRKLFLHSHKGDEKRVKCAYVRLKELRGLSPPLLLLLRLVVFFRAKIVQYDFWDGTFGMNLQNYVQLALACNVKKVMR